MAAESTKTSNDNTLELLLADRENRKNNSAWGKTKNGIGDTIGGISSFISETTQTSSTFMKILHSTAKESLLDSKSDLYEARQLARIRLEKLGAKEEEITKMLKDCE